MLARLHNQGVVLIVGSHLSRNVLMEVLLQGMVIPAAVVREQGVPLSNSAGICVNDKNRSLERVEQNAVGGFRTYTVNGQQFRAELRCWYFGQGIAVGAGVLRVPFHHTPQSLSFDPKIAAGAQQLLEFGYRQGQNGGGIEAPSIGQIANSFFNISPIGVLG